MDKPEFEESGLQGPGSHSLGYDKTKWQGAKFTIRANYKEG